ncbi:MAG: FecR domain-containing protein [Bacteroidales bacterium]|jgi:hypothetical protein|nr:FecR domain-containing protein [Bacteroidales bacterium]
MRQEKEYRNYTDFLKEDKFIEWRLLQTPELDLYWEDFIKNHPERKNDIAKAVEKFNVIRLNDHQLPQEIQEHLYREIIRNTKQRTIFSGRVIYYRIAACVALLIMVTGSFIFFQRNKAIEDIPSIANAIVGTPLPSSSIRLVSADKVIELDENAEISVSTDGNAVINGEKMDITAVKPSGEIMNNQLIVPPGKRSTLQLADGTKVWVNSGTTVRFPTSFDKTTRNIHVIGEIYIEVAETDQPFYVHTPQFDIMVHGTKFNVSAYSDMVDQAVVLVEGKVEVNTSAQSNIMVPGEILCIHENKIDIRTVNTDEYTSWKDGILIMNGTPISEILKKLGRYYNVVFEDQSKDLLSSKTCSGKLFLAENLDDVMISLSVLSSTRFSRENDIIFIDQ